MIRIIKLQPDPKRGENRLKMKYDINEILSLVKAQTGELLWDKGLILIALASSGFIQVVVESGSYQMDLVWANLLIFCIMCLLGVIKHVKAGNPDNREFGKKTMVNIGITICLIGVFYAISILFNVINRVASDLIINSPVSPKSAVYFIYTGYMVAFTNNFLKAAELFDQVAPEWLPKWVSGPFRRYRKSGRVLDLLEGSDDETPTPTPEP